MTFNTIDHRARELAALPLLMVGIALSHVAAWLIRLAAWLMDMELK